MGSKHTLGELNNLSREELITIILGMQGQLDALNENIEMCIRDRYVIVEQVQHEILESPEKVYNLEVEEYHTYYADGVVVHNIGGCGGTGKAKSVDDLINESQPGRTTKGKSIQYEKSGGFGQAKEDFNSLNPSNVRQSGNTIIGELSDGRTANVRPNSSQGSATLDIYNSCLLYTSRCV